MPRNHRPDETARWLARFGQVIAIVASAAAAALYIVLLIFNPYASQPFSWAGLNRVPIVMIVLQIAAAMASVSRHVGLMYVLFVCMFVPVGWYSILLPSMYRWIGVSNLVFLVGTILVTWSRRSRTGRP